MRSSALLFAVAATFTSAGLAAGQSIYGITRDNRLVSFNAAAPGTLISDNAISGLASGETVLSIDVRPLTGEIFVIGSSNRMYSVTPAGAATGIGAGFSALANSQVSFDFNPTVDRMRVVDSTGLNRRLNPTNGLDIAPVNDTPLTYAAGGTPRAAGVAYTNAQFGANVPMGSIREYILDSNLNILGEVGTQAGGNASFNGGVVTPVGALGFDLGDDAGFDIFGPIGTAYISDLTPNGPRFYTLNLNTGLASFVGNIGDGSRLVTDISAAIPSPGTGAAALLGLAVLARRRRA